MRLIIALFLFCAACGGKCLGGACNDYCAELGATEIVPVDASSLDPGDGGAGPAPETVCATLCRNMLAGNGGSPDIVSCTLLALDAGPAIDCTWKQLQCL